MTDENIILDPMRAIRIIHGMVMERSDESEFMGLLYMISHQAGSPLCAKNHPDWHKRALEMEKTLVEARLIPPWPQDANPENPFDKIDSEE